MSNQEICRIWPNGLTKAFWTPKTALFISCFISWCKNITTNTFWISPAFRFLEWHEQGNCGNGDYHIHSTLWASKEIMNHAKQLKTSTKQSGIFQVVQKLYNFSCKISIYLQKAIQMDDIHVYSQFRRSEVTIWYASEMKIGTYRKRRLQSRFAQLRCLNSETPEWHMKHLANEASWGTSFVCISLLTSGL